jgi:hypothetical protein
VAFGADLYTADEMTQAGRPEAPAPQPSARERVAQRAAAVTVREEEPAEGLFSEAASLAMDAGES